jgi:hypothetical protein
VRFTQVARHLDAAQDYWSSPPYAGRTPRTRRCTGVRQVYYHALSAKSRAPVAGAGLSAPSRGGATTADSKLEVQGQELRRVGAVGHGRAAARTCPDLCCGCLNPAAHQTRWGGRISVFSRSLVRCRTDCWLSLGRAGLGYRHRRHMVDPWGGFGLGLWRLPPPPPPPAPSHPRRATARDLEKNEKTESAIRNSRSTSCCRWSEHCTGSTGPSF